MVSDYVEEIIPRTSGRVMVRADEIWIKVAGEQKYLFASMDDDSRILASIRYGRYTS